MRVQAGIYAQEFLSHNGFTVVTEDPGLVATDDIAQARKALNEGRYVLTPQPKTVAETLSGRVAIAAPHRCGPMVAAAARAIRAGKVGLPWNVQADCLADMSIEDAIGVIDKLIGLPVLRVHATRAGNTTLLSLDHEQDLTSTITAGSAGIHRYRISGSHGILQFEAKPAATAFLDDLHRAIMTNTKPATGPEEARYLAKVAEAVQRSLASAAPADVS